MMTDNTADPSPIVSNTDTIANEEDYKAKYLYLLADLITIRRMFIIEFSH